MGKWLNNCISPSHCPYMPALNWVIDNQPMMSVILTQPSSRKKIWYQTEKVIEKVICIYIYIINNLVPSALPPLFFNVY